MIGCFRARRRIWLMVRDDLPERQQQSLEAHLATCAGCQTKFARSEAIVNGVQTLAAEPLKMHDREWSWTRFRTRIEYDAGTTPLPRLTAMKLSLIRWPVPLISVVGIVAVVLGLNYYSAKNRETIPSQRIVIDLVHGNISDSKISIYDVPDPEMTVVCC